MLAAMLPGAVVGIGLGYLLAAKILNPFFFTLADACSRHDRGSS